VGRRKNYGRQPPSVLFDSFLGRRYLSWTLSLKFGKLIH
jgi:hypothetical protein